MSIGKQILLVDSNNDRMNLLYKLDIFHATLPISYLPHPTIYLGRTISWINEVYHYSKFSLLVPLYLDQSFKTFDRLYVSTQLEKSIDAIISTATSFITFANNSIISDQTLLFFSKTVYVTALVHKMIGRGEERVLGICKEAIRLSGYNQDIAVLYDARVALLVLVDLLTF